MANGISRIFESAVVVVEVFTIFLYLSGIFIRNERTRICVVLAYCSFGLALGAASVFYPSMILLPIITIVGVLALAIFLYRNHFLSAIFAALLYLILAVAIEAIVPSLYSKLFEVDLLTIHSFGMERISATITIKLLILLTVKIITIIMGKHRISLQRRMLQSIPFIVCQLILIGVIAGVFISNYVEHGMLSHDIIGMILGLFFVDIVILWYYDLLVDIYELRHKNVIATMQLENQIKYYDTVKSHQDTIAAIEHDMRKHIKAIESMAIGGHTKEVSEYLESFSDIVNENMGLVFTPHPMVSSILSDCRRRAEQNHIDFHFDISIPSTINISNIDITVILGNTIENALEALEKLPEGQRMLRILLKQSEYYLFYEIANTYTMPTPYKEPKNQDIHGYGLKNVRASVEKYEGSLDIKAEADEYTVVAMIPCQAKNTKK